MERCGNYLLEDGRKLGRGGFGEVFQVGVHNLTRTNVTSYARKYFAPCPEYDDTAIKELTDLRQRFLVEIKTQCILNRINYDSIAPIVLFNTNGDKPYFVMELAECNLYESIRNGMSDAEKSSAVIQILKGIITIHENNYIHRDLKPGNILYYSNGKYKITDFGLVKDRDTLRAEVKTKFNPNQMGTDGYRAPEIHESGLFSFQTDIFAVGKIIADIYCAGRSDKLRRLIAKCCAHWPEERYQDAQELLEDFIKVTGV
ncbi:serine/threonine protein kinase [Escherichia coli]|uniref:Serine/threonine protein kinase n=1 Tax=Enterobacter roggenkampii TaxID=1812935 RepID=A0AAX1WFG6_9ENTR|nr:serine/threonine-protein kinase [Enterobacter roggenkampii]EFK3632503.1 serine/threonine protein kinase [Escherichia coli]EGD1680266.1 serine/threonine protein kinase [Escherichia coli]EGG1070602.1 serine/threonine protein kinase [Escherichia coli]MBB7320267.1 serine/threonine protein kinase [Escherichia coli]QLS84087.1 serine/threonine protein kinase [Escherichia coli]